MRRLIAAFAILAAVPAAARASDEAAEAAGGTVEELRAVLELDSGQMEQLQSVLAAGRKTYDAVEKTAREKGADAAREEMRAWRGKLQEDVRRFLSPAQRTKYADWLERKRRWSEEYNKALFGIPMVTEMRLRLALSPAPADAMQRASDEGLEKIRRKVVEMKGAAAKEEEIARAVNELRRATIERMIESAGADQKKVKDFVKAWLQTPESKLSKVERERLARVMKALALQDAALDKRARAVVAAILMHGEEHEWLRRGLAKELLLLLVRPKKDAEVWAAINDFGSLMAVHERRLKSLRADVKELLPTRELAKLVAEGILE